MTLTMVPEGSLSPLLSLDRDCGDTGLHFIHQSLMFKHIRKYLAKMTEKYDMENESSRKNTASRKLSYQTSSSPNYRCHLGQAT